MGSGQSSNKENKENSSSQNQTQNQNSAQNQYSEQNQNGNWNQNTEQNQNGNLNQDSAQNQNQNFNQNTKQTNSWFGGSRRNIKKSRINFNKIKWGSFTKKYNSYIKRHPRKKKNIPDLKHFSQYVNKHPTQFNKKTHKRALFYKNIILRKKK